MFALRSGSPSRAEAVAASATAPSAVDVGFSQAMSAHHQQAVQMAGILLRGHGRSSAVRALASTIELSQLSEIGWMGGWLSLWNAPMVPRGSPMAWMTTNAAYYCRLTHGRMPGLASQQELNRLASLSGRRLDVSFLQFMLRHHEGGVEMALYADRYARLRPVRNLARKIAMDQTQEIALTAQLLRQDGARPLPFTMSPALANSNVEAVLNESPETSGALESDGTAG